MKKHYKITKTLFNKIKNGKHVEDDYVDIYFSWGDHHHYPGITFKPKTFMYIRINHKQILFYPDDPLCLNLDYLCDDIHVIIGYNIEIQDYPFEKEIKQDNINKTIEKWQQTYNYYSSTKL